MNKLTLADIQAMTKGLPPEEMLRIIELVEELEERRITQLCRDSLPAFVLAMQPDYKMGSHLKRLYDLLEALEQGHKDRILVNMAPRFGKSQAISIYFPAWYLGRHPDHKLIIASHTADLAVDMLRKVRNIMQTAEYKRMFPGVDIASDAKAAGKWNTTKGGEAYACIEPSTPVLTLRGWVRADTVTATDRVVVGPNSYPVYDVLHSQHQKTIWIDGVGFSENHPVWTANRGWVHAGGVKLTDILWVENLSDIMKALIRSFFHGHLEHPNVPPLVQHQVTVRKPKQRKVRALRWARDLSVRALATIREFLTGHGAPAFAGAHGGPYRQQRALQPGELPMGHARGARKQPVYQQAFKWADTSRTSEKAGNEPRSDNSAHAAWVQRNRSDYKTQTGVEELGAYDRPEDHGWRGCWSVFKNSFGGAGGHPREPQRRAEGYLACIGRAAKKLQGLLLGVRRPISIETESHDSRPFINYRVGGGNVFYAGGILTHNCGVGGALAGRGAHILIVDDPFSEQDIINGNYAVFDKVYEWFAYGARPRLMPGGRCAILHTRWATKDLTARLLKDSALNPQADQYELFEFPALLNEGSDTEKSLWPEQWSLEALLKTKASMPTFQWNAQYQQNPTNADGGIVVKDWFNEWEKLDPPKCEFVLMSLDAAVEAKQRSDFNALQTWGVFHNEDTGRYELILLNSVAFRAEFPELKDKCLEEYKFWQPDTFIIEAKANGAPLLQEFRRMGMVLQSFTPHRGTGDKTARLNSVADIVRDGLVWVPQTRWAEELVENVTTFPAADHDDITDSFVLALMRFRSGGFISLSSDEPDDEDAYDARPPAAYY